MNGKDDMQEGKNKTKDIHRSRLKSITHKYIKNMVTL